MPSRTSWCSGSARSSARLCSGRLSMPVLLLVLVRLGLARMHDAIGMLGRRVQGVELELLGGGGVDDVVLGAGRNDDGDPVFQQMLFAIEQGFSPALLDADELVVARVVFHADFFARLQGHDDQLAARD